MSVLPQNKVDDEHKHDDCHTKNTNTNTNIVLLKIDIFSIKDWLSVKIFAGVFWNNV